MSLPGKLAWFKHDAEPEQSVEERELIQKQEKEKRQQAIEMRAKVLI